MGWMGQHSCGPGPLPPACLNLAPASGDPAPPPRAAFSLGSRPGREGLVLGMEGAAPFRSKGRVCTEGEQSVRCVSMTGGWGQWEEIEGY